MNELDKIIKEVGSYDSRYYSAGGNMQFFTLRLLEAMKITLTEINKCVNIVNKESN
ncbi:hypothetical protein LCGC14_0543770 [marine sediment metagenome]|uniref:Uncharacterized protein n=1 Tax=marine sediment metagenome TaxID=412755 RepID=A0A0F9V0C5_9ZZZZ